MGGTEGYLPSQRFPSDHLPVVFDLRFRAEGAGDAAASSAAGGAAARGGGAAGSAGADGGGGSAAADGGSAGAGNVLPAALYNVGAAAEALARSEVLAVPTDTLYGLAACANSSSAVRWSSRAGGERVGALLLHWGRRSATACPPPPPPSPCGPCLFRQWGSHTPLAVHTLPACLARRLHCSPCAFSLLLPLPSPQVAHIYATKQRGDHKPLAICVADVGEVGRYGDTQVGLCLGGLTNWGYCCVVPKPKHQFQEPGRQWRAGRGG